MHQIQLGTQKINLLHVITGLGVGGAERVVLDLATSINKEKFNVKVISLSKRVEMLETFQEKNVDVIALRKDSDLKNIIQMVKLLNSFLRENEINIIHAHMSHALIISSIVKLFNPKVKIVFTSHNIDLESNIRELLIFLIKPLRSLDIIFSKNQLKYFYLKKYQCIPNGINIKDYELKVDQQNKFIFLSIGRLEEQKNHKALLEYVEKLKKLYDFEVWIAGDGYLRKELEAIVKTKKLEKYIKFLGIRKDIPTLLNQVHCFVLPSLWEGLPIAILEAGASRVPVISTPVGSIPSLLNNENAYLATNAQFSEKMIEVMQNYEEALKKAEKLKTKIMTDYSLESIVKKHEDIYIGLVNE